jgi:hypothetical protein
MAPFDKKERGRAERKEGKKKSKYVTATFNGEIQARFGSPALPPSWSWTAVAWHRCPSTASLSLCLAIRTRPCRFGEGHANVPDKRRQHNELRHWTVAAMRCRPVQPRADVRTVRTDRCDTCSCLCWRRESRQGRDQSPSSTRW